MYILPLKKETFRGSLLFGDPVNMAGCAEASESHMNAPHSPPPSPQAHPAAAPILTLK